MAEASKKVELKVTVANRSRIIDKTGFKGYDVCLNPYVGCRMGCAYCYVRFFIKDEEKPWGEFVRVREHLKDKLPKELQDGYIKIKDGKVIATDGVGNPLKNDEGKQKMRQTYKTVKNEDLRLVIGTMTDPYQPQERKHRITRAALEIILNTKPGLNKVGIFTRSPIVLDDLDLIVKLPRKRVHYTVTPYTKEIIHMIEPVGIATERRFDTIRKLKAAGVRCHVNVAPAIPVISEQFTEEYAKTLAEIGVDEFFTDPLQAYSESWMAITQCLRDHKSFEAIKEIVEDKQAYAEWKELYRARWFEAWSKVRKISPHTLPIWSDHEHKTWIDMNTGEQMDPKAYDEGR